MKDQTGSEELSLTPDLEKRLAEAKPPQIANLVYAKIMIGLKKSENSTL